MNVRVFSARVHAGAIVPDEAIELREGCEVTVVADGDADAFGLSADEEREIAESLAEADRGEVVTARDLLKRLAH